jgi:hypothetical protein
MRQVRRTPTAKGEAMDPWYDLNSWSKFYREEALQQARMQQLGGWREGASAMQVRK